MRFKTDCPKITVVTPNYNQGDFLEKTILSVLNQNYPNLEYIIIDGGSLDGSVEIIKKYEKRLSYWVSEPDNGMYQAINKGFYKSTGDIMCWINSDDILFENSLNTVASVFTRNIKVEWLQGYPSVIDESGKLIFQREPIFSNVYFYLNKHEKSFSFIQQESTFWTRELWRKSGGYLSLNYKLASDFDLWLRFFKYGNMYCINAQLGAFRKREGQQSSNKELYLNEVRKSLNSPINELSFMNKLYFKFLIIIENLFIKMGLKNINKVLQKLVIGNPKIVKID